MDATEKSKDEAIADELSFIQYEQDMCFGCHRPIEALQPGGYNPRHIEDQTPHCTVKHTLPER